MTARVKLAGHMMAAKGAVVTFDIVLVESGVRKGLMLPKPCNVIVHQGGFANQQRAMVHDLIPGDEVFFLANRHERFPGKVVWCS